MLKCLRTESAGEDIRQFGTMDAGSLTDDGDRVGENMDEKPGNLFGVLFVLC